MSRKKRGNNYLNLIDDSDVLRERVQGRTIKEIAHDQNLPPERTDEGLKRALDLLLSSYALSQEQSRALELARLDYYLSRLRGGIENGDPECIRAANSISQRRARLLSLDLRVEEQVNQRVVAYIGRILAAAEKVLSPRDLNNVKREALRINSQMASEAITRHQRAAVDVQAIEQG